MQQTSESSILIGHCFKLDCIFFSYHLCQHQGLLKIEEVGYFLSRVPGAVLESVALSTSKEKVGILIHDVRSEVADGV